MQEIQDLSIDISKNLDLKSVENLSSYLDDILLMESSARNTSKETTSFLNILKELAAIPLVYLMKEKNLKCKGEDRLLEAVGQCLEKILSNADSLPWEFFTDIFRCLFLHLSDTEHPMKVAEISEDSKISLLKSGTYAYRALASEHLDKVLLENFRVHLGHAIYISLQLAIKEKNRELKIAALIAVEEFGMKSHWDQLDTRRRMKLSYTLASFLPGVVMSTTRIARAGHLQNHRVTIEALRCWQHYVFVVMRDEYLSAVVDDLGLPDSLVDLQSKMCLKENKEGNKTKRKEAFVRPTTLWTPEDTNVIGVLKTIIIDREWVESTSSRLKQLFELLIDLQTHPHWRVRVALVHWCQSLFQHCSETMGNCLSYCLSILITLRSDTVEDVRVEAESSLRLFQEGFDPKGHGRLMKLFGERLFGLSTRLPTVIKMGGDEKFVTFILEIEGCLDLMGDQLRDLLAMPSHFERILRAFITLFTYDYTDCDLLMEKLVSEDSLISAPVKARLGRSFRLFRSEQIYKYAASSCAIIGRRGDLPLVVDHCLDFIQESSFHRSEAILVLNLIINGAINETNEALRITQDEKERLVDSILEVLMRLNLFDLPLSVNQKSAPNPSQRHDEYSVVSYQSFKESISVDVAKRNVILTSNALRLTGDCALFLQGSFVAFLTRILCSLMEKAGEGNVLVSHEALTTLQKVATGCGNPSVAELIESSFPFFWFPLSQKLKRLPEFPSSPQVLRVALKCHRGKVKAFVEELVEDVLDSLDTFHSDCSLPLLTVLLSFVEALADNEDQTECNKDLSQDKDKMDKCKKVLTQNGNKTDECNEVLPQTENKMDKCNTDIAQNENKMDQCNKVLPQNDNKMDELNTVLPQSENKIAECNTVLLQNENKMDDWKKVLPQNDNNIEECNKDLTQNEDKLEESIKILPQDKKKEYYNKVASQKEDKLIDCNKILPQNGPYLEECNNVIPQNNNITESDSEHGLKGTLLEFLEGIHESHEAMERELKEETEKIEETEDISAEEGFQKSWEEKEMDEENELADDTFKKETEEDIPNHIKLVVQIMERCSYLLFINERKSQLVILQIIKCCCRVLRDWENQRLPCFHKIWKPLVMRLKDKDFVVLLKALETCVLMVESSGDFLRNRFLKELLPSIILFLESQSSTSLNITKKSGYDLTPAFKAQRLVLTVIPSLFRRLNFDMLTADELLHAVLMYLDGRQPLTLRTLALDALQTINEFYPDLVWIALAFSRGSFRIIPPSASLSPIFINGARRENLDQRVFELFEELS